MSTKEIELIAKQQLEIQDLKDCLNILEENIAGVSTLLFSVGGPLNDSLQKYTFEQRKPFHQIARILAIN